MGSILDNSLRLLHFYPDLDWLGVTGMCGGIAPPEKVVQKREGVQDQVGAPSGMFLFFEELNTFTPIIYNGIVTTTCVSNRISCGWNGRRWR
jgi:hypothetical protein